MTDNAQPMKATDDRQPTVTEDGCTTDDVRPTDDGRPVTTINVERWQTDDQRWRTMHSHSGATGDG
jgi:hypothetical protein